MNTRAFASLKHNITLGDVTGLWGQMPVTRNLSVVYDLNIL